MAHLIDKDAVLAEIERRIKTNKECMLGLRNLDYYQGKVDALNDTISSLNTLEVKEVDFKPIDDNFERDAVQFCFDNGLNTTPRIARTIAKHFFELGMLVSNKAQKGE